MKSVQRRPHACAMRVPCVCAHVLLLAGGLTAPFRHPMLSAAQARDKFLAENPRIRPNDLPLLALNMNNRDQPFFALG